MKFRGVSAKVNFALDGLPVFPALPDTVDHYGGFLNIGPTIEYVERAFDAAKYGWYSERPSSTPHPVRRRPRHGAARQARHVVLRPVRAVRAARAATGRPSARTSATRRRPSSSRTSRASATWCCTARSSRRSTSSAAPASPRATSSPASSWPRRCTSSGPRRAGASTAPRSTATTSAAPARTPVAASSVRPGARQPAGRQGPQSCRRRLTDHALSVTAPFARPGRHRRWRRHRLQRRLPPQRAGRDRRRPDRAPRADGRDHVARRRSDHERRHGRRDRAVDGRYSRDLYSPARGRDRALHRVPARSATCTSPTTPRAARDAAPRARLPARLRRRQRRDLGGRGGRAVADGPVDDILAASYVADEGRADPVGVATSLSKGATARGVTIVKGVSVTGAADRRRAGHRGHSPTPATSSARRSCIAAGLWSRELGAPVRHRHPVAGRRALLPAHRADRPACTATCR